MTDQMHREVDVVHQYWSGRMDAGELTPSSEARYRRVMAAYARFVAAHGRTSFALVDTRLVESFVYAVRTGGLPPAPATSRFRLTVVRDAYVGLMNARVCVADPTSGLAVNQVLQMRVPVPLTPPEVVRLRAAGRVSPRDHLRPACVELALAGATHLEVASAAVSDLDVRVESVRLGSRWVQVEPFALTTLLARAAACRRANRRHNETWDPASATLALPRALATYPETSIAPGISSSLSRALTRAGITRVGLRPASLREYAANRAYALGGIESVATRLGLESLDVARGFIDADWQAAHGQEIREIG
jgi:site-specific recombinase XerD